MANPAQFTAANPLRPIALSYCCTAACNCTACFSLAQHTELKTTVHWPLSGQECRLLHYPQVVTLPQSRSEPFRPPSPSPPTTTSTHTLLSSTLQYVQQIQLNSYKLHLLNLFEYTFSKPQQFRLCVNAEVQCAAKSLPGTLTLPSRIG